MTNADETRDFGRKIIHSAATEDDCIIIYDPALTQEGKGRAVVMVTTPTELERLLGEAKAIVKARGRSSQ